MSVAYQKLLDQALTLSADERLDIAASLLASLDGPKESGWAEAWALELDRRAQTADEGGSPGMEWLDVRARLLDRLAAK